MKAIVYIILLAITLLVVKAFFLDDYLAQRKAAETNTTKTGTSPEEKPESTFSKPVPKLKSSGIYTGDRNLTIEKRKPGYSEMPLEKVGDTIAEKLEEKIRVEEK